MVSSGRGRGGFRCGVADDIVTDREYPVRRDSYLGQEGDGRESPEPTVVPPAPRVLRPSHSKRRESHQTPSRKDPFSDTERRKSHLETQGASTSSESVGQGGHQRRHPV